MDKPDWDGGIIKYFYKADKPARSENEKAIQTESAEALCDRAVEAYERGNKTDAVKLWTAAADKGDDHAQF